LSTRGSPRGDPCQDRVFIAAVRNGSTLVLIMGGFKSAEDMAGDIARKIDKGEWPDGYRLPPERELAASYGLARNTVRRALESLDDRIVRLVGRGTYVRGHGASPVPHFLGRLREASPADVMEVRIIMEPHAAALAAHRAGAEDLAAIEEALRKSLAAKGMAEFEHWDAALHLAICRATKNALLIDYCEAINAARNQPHWYRLKQRSHSEDRRSKYDSDHSAIVAALLQRDAEAARRLLHSHLLRVRDSLMSLPD
jgi:GntR family transcriptional regulator, uxu operon transcriptional repressor